MNVTEKKDIEGEIGTISLDKGAEIEKMLYQSG